MFLKKIKNNNRGADVTLLGTNYLLVIIVVCCAILDLTIIEYGKITITTILKQCEMYALAKHYDNEEMWNEQNLQISNDVQNNIRNTFNSQFNSALGGGNSYMTNVSIANNSAGVSGSGISVVVDTKAQALKITVPKVIFTPKKFLSKVSPSFIPYVKLGATIDGSGTSYLRPWDEEVDVTKTIKYSNLSKMDGIHQVSRNGSDFIVTGASCKIAFIGQ